VAGSDVTRAVNTGTMEESAAGRLRVAVLGLGEAGSEIARDLVAADALVRGYDPRPDRAAPPGAVDCNGEADAVAGSDVVLSANSAADAEQALRSGLPAAAPGTVWADLNTAAPALKRRLADIAEPAGVAFADVALMSTVPGRGVRTPMLVSGPGGARWAALVQALGTEVSLVAGPPGAAAQRKLLRSVFYKGMGAAVVEALAAARAAGLEEWMRDHLRQELSAADAALVDRLEDGSIRHAHRRAAEMVAAGELLTELGVPALVTSASEQWLRILDGEDVHAPDRTGPPAWGRARDRERSRTTQTLAARADRTTDGDALATRLPFQTA
jgi:3-hydroxyisobutyrate dehydrogenase-like beta-hydroxyacid dehydrogenase